MSNGSRAWRFARYVLVFYLLIILIMTFLETWLVYPRPPLARSDWQPAGLSFEDIRFTSADGTKLHGWFVPHPNPKRFVLYCHGNGEQVADNADVVAMLRDKLQASVFIFDYRGYGHSEGSPTEAGCIADAAAAQRWLAERAGIQPNEVVLVGRSLGGGVVTALASEQGAKALILQNTFPTMPDVAALHYPWLPVRWVMKNRYDSLARIQKYRGPLFQSHGAADTLIPTELAKRLFDVAPSGNKQFMQLPGLGHDDLPPSHYFRELATFLDRIGT
jgi:fermentation-respiration switch protein FrsA (DUF1100 family)